METGRAKTEQEARATKAHDQLERQSCLADQDWVSSSTLDAETYLHPDVLEGSRLFFHYMGHRLHCRQEITAQGGVEQHRTVRRPCPQCGKPGWRGGRR